MKTEKQLMEELKELHKTQINLLNNGDSLFLFKYQCARNKILLLENVLELDIYK